MKPNDHNPRHASPIRREHSDSPPLQDGGVSFIDDKDHAEELIRWVFDLFGNKPNADDLKRPVMAHQYHGAYGWAGLIITIEGSPPKGTVVADWASNVIVGWQYGKIIRIARNRTEQAYQKAMSRLNEMGVCTKDEAEGRSC